MPACRTDDPVWSDKKAGFSSKVTPIPVVKKTCYRNPNTSKKDLYLSYDHDKVYFYTFGCTKNRFISEFTVTYLGIILKTFLAELTSKANKNFHSGIENGLKPQINE